MELTDPNAYLGYSASLTSVLILVATFVVGVLVATVSARLMQLPVWMPNCVLAVHMIVGTAAYAVLGPFSMSPDGHTYDSQAVTIASRFGMEAPYWFSNALHPGKEGFPSILGVIYSFLGREPLAAIGLNSITTAITAIVLMATTRKAFGAVNPWPLAIYLCLMPAFITLGPAVMREAMCWLGISLVSYLVASYLAGSGILSGSLMGLVGFALLFYVRTGLAALVLVAVVVAIGTVIVWRLFGAAALATLAVLGTLVVLLVGDVILTIAGYNPTYVINNRNFNANFATTGYTVWTGPLEVFGITGYMIAALPKILLGPLPWELGPQLVWAWVLFSTVFWWAAIWIIARIGIRKGLTTQFLGFTVMSLVLLIALAAFFSNYGVLSRMRSLPLVVMLVIIGGVGAFTKTRNDRVFN